MPDAEHATRKPAYLKLALFTALLVGAYLAARTSGLLSLTDVHALAPAIRDLRERPFVAPLFVVVYALATTLALPGSVLTIAGGAIFGFGMGTLLNWLGASIGAVLAFLLARSLGLEAVQRLLGRRGDRLIALAGANGFLAVLRLRLIPVVPFNLLNFAAGLAGVRFRDYALGTLIGLIPGTMVYTYFADALLAGAAGARRDALVRLLIAGALLVTLSFLPALVRKSGWRRRAPLGAALALVLTAAGLPAQHAQADHRAFDVLLREHVVNGLVDYNAFERSPEFRRYLAMLDSLDPATLGEQERLAYWINVYNAYTIELINRHGERRSIRNINKSFGFLKLKGPWGESLVKAGGRRLTLDDVEHRIIRKEFREPRIHFALVCAAMGCPPLRSEAYTGAKLDEQLHDQGRTFLLLSPTKNRVEVSDRTVHVSMIFNYYRADFGGTPAAVGKFIARWLPDGAERRLLESGDFALKETRYDWALNSQAR